MIKLKSLLQEDKDTKASDKPADLVSVNDSICKWFKSSKASLAKLAKEDNWKEFYQKGFDKFPDAQPAEVSQAMNTAAGFAGFFKNEEVAEMPTEKELEDAAFGEKKLQKGIKMGDYVKKNKAPKNADEDLVQPMKESVKKRTIREGVMSDIDIIAQESATVQIFIQKVKKAYPKLNEPGADVFLTQLYDESKKSSTSI